MEAVPLAEIESNDKVLLVTTTTGGHLGWVTTQGGPFGAPWPYAPALEFLSAAMERPRKGAREEAPASAAMMDNRGGRAGAGAGQQQQHEDDELVVVTRNSQ